MVLKVKINHIFFMLFVLVLLFSSAGIQAAVSVYSQKSDAALPIVMYHQLTKSQSKAGRYVLTVEQFENDLKYLKTKGYESVTVNEVINYVKGNGDLPPKAIMITFDDGCETLYSYALPLLEKYGFTAVGFVVGSLADKYTELDDHNLNYSCLNWDEIKEMSSGNVVDIQSHSFDLHNNSKGRSGAAKMKNETLEQYSEFLMNDTSIMKERMLDKTGKVPVAFAYPFGSYSKESEDILKKCGMEMVLTCEERINIIKKTEPECLFRLGRYNRPNGISSESFFEKMGIG